MSQFNQAASQFEEILKPILYADIFDYPLTFEEVYKFLEVETNPADAQKLLDDALEQKIITLQDGFYSLAGRAHLSARRQKRFQASEKLWPGAIHYGRWIASLPFVRLVAVTGSLAVNNPRDGVDDIDYLVVTQRGRLWLCRAMIIMLVKYCHRQGVHLCPNYLITENVLGFDDDFFTAREMLQMKPIYGKKHYLKMQQINAWIADYFPQGAPNLDKLNDRLPSGRAAFKQAGEFVLRGGLGDLLERWLQKIQITKHTRRAAQYGARDKVIFTADICKGHYNSHNNKTMDAYRQRIEQYANGNLLTRNGKIKNDA